jgi:hypothetical protein
MNCYTINSFILKSICYFAATKVMADITHQSKENQVRLEKNQVAKKIQSFKAFVLNLAVVKKTHYLFYL